MKLPYGKSSLTLPDLWGGRAIWLEPGPFGTVDGREVIERALDEPVDSPSIRSMDFSGKKIACVVPDLTRRAAVDVYLTVLLSRLLSAGAAAENMTVVVALGIHRPLETRELRNLVGEEVWDRFSVINHDPDAEGGNINLGVTSRGIPVEINRTVATADKVILTRGDHLPLFCGLWRRKKDFPSGCGIPPFL